MTHVMFYLGRRQHDTWKANLILRWSPKEIEVIRQSGKFYTFVDRLSQYWLSSTGLQANQTEESWSQLCFILINLMKVRGKEDVKKRAPVSSAPWKESLQ